MNGRNSIPQTIVIDTDGRVVKHWSGYAAGRSGDRLKDAIDQALPQRPRNKNLFHVFPMPRFVEVRTEAEPIWASLTIYKPESRPGWRGSHASFVSTGSPPT